MKPTTIYNYAKTYMLNTISIALDIFVDEHDVLVGVYFSAKDIRGTAFRTLFRDVHAVKAHPSPSKLLIVQEFDAYFNGDLLEFTAPYRFIAGTDFQKSVWKEIAKIAPKQTLSYSDLAKRVCQKTTKSSKYNGYSRTVGTATGTNPLSIVVPCHRVLPKSSLQNYGNIFADVPKQNGVMQNLPNKLRVVGNYGGSPKVKLALLDLEHRVMHHT